MLNGTMRAVLLVDQKQNTAGIIKTYLMAGGYSVDHTPDPTGRSSLRRRRGMASLSPTLCCPA